METSKKRQLILIFGFVFLDLLGYSLILPLLPYYASDFGATITLVGLLGTTLGMIRAFQALAESGTVSATQLSIGISEALYNTAGGLLGAIVAIVAYNFFTTKVDNFVYVIDEGILSVTEIFTSMVRK